MIRSSATPDPTIRVEEVPACYLCGAPGRTLYEKLPDRLSCVLGTWNFSICSNPTCGLIWLNPRPVPADMGKAYRNYLTHVEKPTYLPRYGRRMSNLHQRLWVAYDYFSRRMGLKDLINTAELLFLDQQPPGRLLDIGCGAGGFLRNMRDRGWEVEGVDQDPVVVENTRKTHGLKVHLGTVSDADLPHQAYDVITLQHAIEHVYDPREELQKCRPLLKPGGRLVVATPNRTCRNHRAFGRHWFPLDPPRHLNLFSPENLRYLFLCSGYPSVEIRTSVAHNYIFYRSSLEVRRDGHCEPFRHPYWDHNLQAMFHQSIAYQCRYQADWGEEIVATAVMNP